MVFLRDALKEAKERSRQGHFEESIVIIQDALEKHKTMPKELGLCGLTRHDFEGESRNSALFFVPQQQEQQEQEGDDNNNSGGDADVARCALCRGTVADHPNTIHHDPMPALLFHLGTCHGNMKRDAAALDIAEQLIARFPARSEGHYLRAMSLTSIASSSSSSSSSTSNSMDEARGAFNKAQEVHRAYPGADTPRQVEQAADQMCALLKRRGQERYRGAVQRHCAYYSVYESIRCWQCGTCFSVATPEWLCGKCWPGKDVHVWEPDHEHGTCALCKHALGALKRHHCRCCGRLVCNTCSSHTECVPVIGFTSPVRVCDECAKRMAERRAGGGKLEQQHHQEQEQHDDDDGEQRAEEAEHASSAYPDMHIHDNDGASRK